MVTVFVFGKPDKMNNNGNNPSNETIIEYKTDREKMYEAAKFYTEHGWIIHALSPADGDEGTAGKAPVTYGWQKQPNPRTDNYIEKHWGENTDKKDVPYNIGLQCGKSSGVVVIDLDDDNPYIIGELFKGIDKSGWVIQQRTPKRSHYFFKYNSEFHLTHLNIVGIDFLTDRGNCVLEPSNHKSGDVYRFLDCMPNGSEDLPEMPEELTSRLLKLFARASNLQQIINSCRPCIKNYFNEHAWKTRNPDNWHTNEGRKAALATATEAAFKGATYDELILMAKIMYRKDYKADLTEGQLNSVTRYIKEPESNPWRCETIRSECSMITGDMCESCKAKDKVRTEDRQDAAKGIKYFGKLKKGEQQDTASEEFLKRYHCIHFKGYGLATYRDGIYVQLETEEAKKSLLEMINEWGYAPTSTELKHILEMIEIKAHQAEKIFLGAENPELVAFENGIVNLYTGDLTEFDPKTIIFNKFPVTYTPTATGKPMFDRFMSEVFKGNEIGIKQFQEFGGYCLYRGFPIHAFFVLIGTGGNGKSELIKIVKHVLGGNENITAYSMQDFFAPKEASILAEHHNKVANLSSETEVDTIKSTKTGKALTGGDSVTARRLYGHPITFVSYSKAMFCANSVPIIEDNTGALVQRMIPIILPNKFRGTDREVLSIADKIKEVGEMPAILNWFIEGFRRLMEQKHFTRAQSASLDAAMYSRLSMPFEYFVDEYCCESDGYDIEYTTAENALEAIYKYREMYPQSADLGNQRSFKAKLEKACKNQGLTKVRYHQKKVSGQNKKVYLNLIIETKTLNADYEAAMKRKAEGTGNTPELSEPLPELTEQLEKTQEQKDIDSICTLLIRAMNKHVKAEGYNGVVEDVHSFVSGFNEKTPEFLDRLGYERVFDTAMRLKQRGFRY